MKKALLVLGGGAARGLAHIGVIGELEKHFEICGIIGTSIGAIVGAMRCLGHSADAMRDMAISFPAAKVISPLNLDRSIRGIFDGRPVVELFEKWTDMADIEDAALPFIAVAYDLVAKRSILINQGSFAGAMRASSSIPLMFAPHQFGKHWCIDGGVEHPLPLAFSNIISSDLVVAVNVLPQIESIALVADPIPEPHAKKPSFHRWEILTHTLFQNQSYLALQEIIRYQPDIVIETAMPNSSAFAFDRAEEFIEYGRGKCRETLDNYREADFVTRLRKQYLNLLHG